MRSRFYIDPGRKPSILYENSTILLFSCKNLIEKKGYTKKKEGGKNGAVSFTLFRREASLSELKEAHHSKPQKENETFWTLVEVQGVKLGEDSLWQELSASKIEWFPLSPTQSYSLSTSLLKKLFNQLLYWLWNFRKLLGEKVSFLSFIEIQGKSSSRL